MQWDQFSRRVSEHPYFVLLGALVVVTTVAGWIWQLAPQPHAGVYSVSFLVVSLGIVGIIYLDCLIDGFERRTTSQPHDQKTNQRLDAALEAKCSDTRQFVTHWLLNCRGEKARTAYFFTTVKVSEPNGHLYREAVRLAGDDPGWCDLAAAIDAFVSVGLNTIFSVEDGWSIAKIENLLYATAVKEMGRGQGFPLPTYRCERFAAAIESIVTRWLRIHTAG